MNLAENSDQKEVGAVIFRLHGKLEGMKKIATKLILHLRFLCILVWVGKNKISYNVR